MFANSSGIYANDTVNPRHGDDLVSEDFKHTVAAMGKYPDAYTYDYTKQKFQEMKPAFLAFYESVKHKL